MLLHLSPLREDGHRGLETLVAAWTARVGVICSQWEEVGAVIVRVGRIHRCIDEAVVPCLLVHEARRIVDRLVRNHVRVRGHHERVVILVIRTARVVFKQLYSEVGHDRRTSTK